MTFARRSAEGQRRGGDVPASVHDELRRAQEIGALGPGDIDEHITHAAGFLEAIAAVDPGAPRGPRHVLDLGAGGGVPGLVIAALAPTWTVTLLDGRTERIRHLVDAIERLGWSDRVATVAMRAEEAAHRVDLRFAFDAAVARAFASPPVTAECGAGFLRPGGYLVVSDPPDGDPGRWPSAGLAELGLVRVALPSLSRAFSVMQAENPCSERFPRRVGIPAKRPLFGADRP